LRNQSHQARECGRRFFVVRAFIIIEIGSIAVARFAGLLIIARHTWGCALSRFTPGFTLSPAPQAEDVKSRFAQKFG
jgi:hypothetical protein